MTIDRLAPCGCLVHVDVLGPVQVDRCQLHAAAGSLRNALRAIARGELDPIHAGYRVETALQEAGDSSTGPLFGWSMGDWSTELRAKLVELEERIKAEEQKGVAFLERLKKLEPAPAPPAAPPAPAPTPSEEPPASDP